MSESEKLIGTIDKNKSEVLRVSRTTYEGVELVDCRVWVKETEDGQPAKPTKKGLTLRPQTWEELLSLVQTALAALDGAAEEPADDDFFGEEAGPAVQDFFDGGPA